MTKPPGHWLPQARISLSPNFNARPPGTEIRLLVIHNISLPVGQYGNGCIEQLFTNCLDCDAHADFGSLRGVEVSAHLLIDRQGGITQFVDFQQRAWHAGVSVFDGVENCNDYSIGIELEGVDNSPYTEQQYQSLIEVTRQILREYPGISVDSIVGHSDIAPERKTDPGPAFDWQRYKQALLT